MLSSSVQSYGDPGPYESAFVGAKVGVLPTARGAFSARAMRVVLDRLWIARADESAPCIKHVRLLPNRAFITFLTEPGPELVSDGVAVPAIGLMRHSAAHSYHERSTGPTSWGVMSLPTEELADAGVAISGCDLMPPRDTLRVIPPAKAMAKLRRLHADAGILAGTAPGVAHHPEVSRALKQSLIEAMISCLRKTEPREEKWAQRSHETVMRRFRRVLDDNPDSALYIPEICAAINVPDRTLRLCCQEHLGMGPKQYLMLRRMHLARRALQLADNSVTTITETATQFGFWHFGRFAGVYRSIFGESPSATLNRPPAKALRDA